LLKDFSKELEDRSVSRKCLELCQKFTKDRSALLFTGSYDALPPEIERKACFYEIRLPDEKEIAKIVKSVVKSLRNQMNFEIDINQEVLDRLLKGLKGLSGNQIRQSITHAILLDKKLSQSTIERVVEKKIQFVSDGGLLEYYPPDENAYEIGGFDNLKEWIERAKLAFGKDASKYNLSPPKGVLLVGVPGCGKSLSAKIIARQWGLPLLKLEADRLYDKFIGETEKNFRSATDLAESMAPVVFWVDELEKAIHPGSGGDSDSGLSKRLFGSFLTWLQEKKEDVFVVATANQIDQLPPELMRKGRFDEIFYVDLPVQSEREAIFDIHLGIRKLDPKAFEIVALARACEGFTGSEIEQVVISGIYRALHEKTEPTQKHFLDEIESTIPLSQSRHEEISKLREYVSGRFVNVSKCA
jgi:SpoVK/Ycf46/Vps4 family AAA+-type ATPase